MVLQIGRNNCRRIYISHLVLEIIYFANSLFIHSEDGDSLKNQIQSSTSSLVLGNEILRFWVAQLLFHTSYLSQKIFILLFLDFFVQNGISQCGSGKEEIIILLFVKLHSQCFVWKTFCWLIPTLSEQEDCWCCVYVSTVMLTNYSVLHNLIKLGPKCRCPISPH